MKYLKINAMINEACKLGLLEIVKDLYKLSPNKRHSYSLPWASEYGHLDIVKYLFKQSNEESRKIALRWAANNNHLDVVKYLVERGVDIKDTFYKFELGKYKYFNKDVYKFLKEQMEKQ